MILLPLPYVKTEPVARAYKHTILSMISEHFKSSKQFIFGILGGHISCTMRIFSTYLLFLFFRLRYCSYLKDCLLSFLYADREMSLIFIDVFMFMWNGCWGICSQTNKLVHNRKSLIYSAVFTKNTYIHLHLIWFDLGLNNISFTSYQCIDRYFLGAV